MHRAVHSAQVTGGRILGVAILDNTQLSKIKQSAGTVIIVSMHAFDESEKLDRRPYNRDKV